MVRILGKVLRYWESFRLTCVEYVRGVQSLEAEKVNFAMKLSVTEMF